MFYVPETLHIFAEEATGSVCMLGRELHSMYGTTQPATTLVHTSISYQVWSPLSLLLLASMERLPLSKSLALRTTATALVHTNSILHWPATFRLPGDP